MTVKEEIEQFLTEFKQKLEIWGIRIREDRSKNFRTMAELELSSEKLKSILRELKVVDYSQGPEEDLLYQKQQLWIFGKKIKNQEVYIKITLGDFNDKVICISFHFSEYPMEYPFK